MKMSLCLGGPYFCAAKTQARSPSLCSAIFPHSIGRADPLLARCILTLGNRLASRALIPFRHLLIMAQTNALQCHGGENISRFGSRERGKACARFL
jgi:hypothetical protein